MFKALNWHVKKKKTGKARVGNILLRLGGRVGIP